MNRRVTDIDVESLAALSICGSHVQTEAAPKATSCEGLLFFPPETARARLNEWHASSRTLLSAHGF
jgi:hypothetical protein